MATMKVADVLKKMGVPQHLHGWDYISYAIELIQEDREMMYCVTKWLYPAIAKKYGTTATRVERGIRNAVEASMYNIKPELFEEVFGNSVPSKKDKPCNRHYIAALVRYMEESD